MKSEFSSYMLPVKSAMFVPATFLFTVSVKKQVFSEQHR